MLKVQVGGQVSVRLVADDYMDIVFLLLLSWSPSMDFVNPFFCLSLSIYVYSIFPFTIVLSLLSI